MSENTNDNESPLIRHAHTELDRVGLFDGDADYDGMIGDAVMSLVSVFVSQEHSGFSAGMTRDLFSRLTNFENLSPLTDDPDEWEEHCDDMWQNRRNSKAFSKDHGQTYTLLDDAEGPGTIHQTQESKR